MGSPADKERWLILSYFSNVDGMATASHIDDRLPVLRSMGVEPILLTGPCGDPHRDFVHVRVPSVAPSGMRFELRHLVRRKASGGIGYRILGAASSVVLLPFYLLEKLLLDLDSQWSWFPLAALYGRRLCARCRPARLFSTGGPVSGHVAAAIIARRSGIPWIAEFQDPLVHGGWLRSRTAQRVYAWTERLVCGRAGAVVFVTEGARRAADGRTGLGGRGRVIYPGADLGPSCAEEYRKGSSCRFAHFGSLGGSRNADAFLAALERLFRDRPELAASVRLDLYGTCDRPALSRIEAFPHPGVVTLRGRLSRSESRAAMRRSDVLLLIQNTSDFSSETIPSKTYEYLQAGRPILGLVYRNPELAGMLSAQGHMVVDAEDPGAVKEGITGCLIRWRESGPGGAALPASPYTVDEAVRRLVAISGELRNCRPFSENIDA